MSNRFWKIGELTVTRIVESETAMPFEGLFPTASAEVLEAHREWLYPDFMDASGRMRLSIHALVVDAPSCRVLVDTCVGQHAIPGFEAMSKGSQDLRTSLASAGFATDSIDVVLCTHLHFDHVGWNTMQENGNWVPTFPNARYLFARKEWDHWNLESESDLVPNLDNAVRPVFAAGLADLVETDHQVCAEVRLVPTPGHTPGHVSVALESTGARGLITGDATHHPVQWAEPDWASSADTDTRGSTETRQKMIGDCADQDVLVIGTHYSGPTAGHVLSHGKSRIFRGVR
ncbi:MBL fold metallo-hydrolase [Myxococcota bacterium]|nr:MBL fold metallo-hydrolase [Myxococcota bacterium]